MALVKCPECGKKVSDKAEYCINCGYPMHHEIKHTILPTSDDQINQQADVQMSQKKRNLIILSIVTIVALIIGILVWQDQSEKTKMKQRDLSYVFNITFDMAKEDIIEYEALTYGNAEYKYDYTNNRLDFDSYSNGGTKKWKHKYFFDEDTGLLTDVYYMDITVTFGGGSDAECEHIKGLKKALLDEINEWDETTNDGLFKIAYGTIDGVKCKIKYQDGNDKAFFISRND